MKVIQFIAMAIALAGGSMAAIESPNEGHSPFFWGFGLDGYPIDAARLQNLKQQTGISPQIIQFYLQWPSPKEKISSLIPTLQAIKESGALPCITWEPMYYDHQDRITIEAQDILSGGYDEYMRYFAKIIKDWGKPLLLRFAHEMNLDEYHWGTKKRSYGPESPKIYIKLFRYIVDLFRKENVSNVLWIYCPNCDSVPDEPWNTIANYYPGNGYVDILGIDGYDWAKNSASSKSFESIFATSYMALKAIAPKKPMIVFETASPYNKSEWISNALKTAQKWHLQGIVWFQVDKERHWAWIPQNESDLKMLPSGTHSQDQWANSLLQKR
jgi:beta-mannanase